LSWLQLYFTQDISERCCPLQLRKLVASQPMFEEAEEGVLLPLPFAISSFTSLLL
jgi:hypothetical protein